MSYRDPMDDPSGPAGSRCAQERSSTALFSPAHTTCGADMTATLPGAAAAPMWPGVHDAQSPQTDRVCLDGSPEAPSLRGSAPACLPGQVPPNGLGSRQNQSRKGREGKGTDETHRRCGLLRLRAKGRESSCGRRPLLVNLLLMAGTTLLRQTQA